MSKQSFTNTVFYIQSQGKKSAIEVFIPCYARISFKKIGKINVKQQKAEMVATMVLSFLCKNIDEEMRCQIINNLELTMNGQDHLKLTDTDTRIKRAYDSSKFLLTYTIRHIFPLQMSNEQVVWAPFDTIDLNLFITLRTIQMVVHNQSYNIKFNCMDIDNRQVKFAEIGSQSLGQFQLAKQRIEVQYTNSQRKILLTQQQKKKQYDEPAKEKLKKIQSFQYANFQVTVYRLPTTTLFTIFFPLWLLAMINLALFFTAKEFKDRVANIATLLVAFTAFIPTIRQRIPPTPKATLTDIIVYSLLINTLLCLVRSFNIKDIDDKQYAKIQWKWQSDYLFIISASIFFLTFLIVMIVHLIFKTVWQPNYNLKIDDGPVPVKFNPKDWHNQDCDNYFENLRPYFRIKL